MPVDAHHRMACLVGAQARARARGRPVLLRLHGWLADPEAGAAREPWRHGGGDGPVALWHDGGAQTTLAAWGALQRWPLGGQRAAAAARSHIASLNEALQEEGWGAQAGPRPNAPLCHVALAFDGAGRARTAGAPAGARPAGRSAQRPSPAGGHGGELLLPACQLVRRRGDAGIGFTLARWVAPNDPLEGHLSALEAWHAQLRDRPEEAGSPPPASMSAEAEESAEMWARRVHEAAGAVASGALDKVVLARSAAWAAPPGRCFSAVATAWALRRRQAASITFLWARDDGAAFVGASPETLVNVAGAQVTTHALAGTTGRSRDPGRDRALAAALLASGKDRREHQVVVEMLRAALQPHCRRVEVAAAPEILALVSMQHLQTRICGALRPGVGVMDLVASLHPTPAVCGWPTAAAYAYLRAHERLERGWYAGPLGWVTAAGDGIFAVALRSAWLHGARARAYAGAGIVAASEPGAEWRETELKLSTVARALRLENRAAPEGARRLPPP